MIKNKFMKKKYWSWSFLMAILLVSACQKGEMDFNKKSNYYDVDREISLPLVYGKISFDDLLNVVPDTFEIIDYIDTLNIYYNLEYDHVDTLKMSKLSKNISVDFAKLFYWFTNEFPVGLDTKIYMLDTIHQVIIDSILFTNVPGQIFLQPAPVDVNGIVIQDSVKQESGYIDIDSSQADNLIQRANRLILFSRVYANSFSIVKVPQTSFLQFKFSIDIQGRYQGYNKSAN
jgi:hypothetical protein